MAVKSKAQLGTDISGSSFTSTQKTILDDMVDSYENYLPRITTATRNAIVSPEQGYLIYNTETDQYEYYNGFSWAGMGQSLGVPQTVKVDFSSAQLLSLYTTPKKIVESPGSGFASIPISFVWIYTYGTTQYATNKNLRIYYNTKTATQFLGKLDDALATGSDKSYIVPCTSASDSDSIIDDADIMATIATGNPTAGDGTASLILTYYTIAI